MRRKQPSRLAAVFLAAIVILTITPVTGAATVAAAPVSQATLAQIIDKMAVYQQENPYYADAGSTMGQMQMFGLARSGRVGQEVLDKWFDAFEAAVLATGGDGGPGGMGIVAATACGYDAAAVGGYDLTRSPSAEDKGAWGLIVLDSKPYRLDDQGLALRFAALQQLKKQSTYTDTAAYARAYLTLIALAPYFHQGDKDAEQVVGIKLGRMSDTLDTIGTSTPDHLVNMIIALTSLGLDPLSERIQLPGMEQPVTFLREDGNLIQGILPFLCDGDTGRPIGLSEAEQCRSIAGTKYNPYTMKPMRGQDQDVTNSVFLALVAYERFLKGENSIYDLSDVTVTRKAGTNQAPYLLGDARKNPEVSAAFSYADSYRLDLKTIFSDAEEDPLTYHVSVNGGPFEKAGSQFVYSHNTEDQVTLVFKAADGQGESLPYKVNIAFYEDMTMPSLVYSVGPAGVSIVSCASEMEIITVPDTIEGKPVTNILSNAFAHAKNLTAVKLPETVRTINSSAFWRLDHLTTVNLPEKLWGIGTKAFMDDTALSQLVIPAGVEEIQTDAFWGCPNLRFEVDGDNPYYSARDGILYNKDQTELIAVGRIEGSSFTVPDSVVTIGEAAFRYAQVDRVVLGKNVRTIEEDAFFGAPIQEIVLNEGLEQIGDRAFAFPVFNLPYGARMKEIALPSSLAGLGTEVFKNNGGLERADLSAVRIAELPPRTFESCGSLQEVKWPGTIRVLGSGAFQGCRFKTLSLPQGLTTIGGAAFYGCRDLEGLTIPDTVTSIDMLAFDGCSGLKTLTLPQRLEAVGGGAFGRCASLTQLTFPAALKKLGYSVFRGCSSLTDLYFEGNLPQMGSLSPGGDQSPYDSPFYNPFDQPTPNWSQVRLHYLQGASGWDKPLVVTTGLATFTFHPEVYLPEDTRLVLHAPASPWVLEAGSVSEDLRVTGSGSLSGVDSGALTWRSSAERVARVDQNGRVTAVKEGRAEITASAIRGGKGYSAVVDVHVEDNCIFKWSMLADATIRIDGLKDDIKDDFHGEVKIPDEIGGYRVTRIGENAFLNNTGITAADIPGSVNTIEWSAFSGCAAMKSVQLGDGIQTIYGYAFQNSGVTSVEIPASVTQFNRAFTECRDLTSVIVNGAYISPSAFQSCTALTDLTLKEGVKTIAEGAFSNCSALRRVELPASLSTILSGAFYYCTSLEEVVFQKYMLENHYPNSINRFFYGCSDDLKILHPDDGSDWGGLFRNAVATAVNLPGGPAGIVETGDAAAAGAEAAGQGLQENGSMAQPEVGAQPESGVQPGADQSPAEQQAGEGPRRNVFEIVNKTVRENPLGALLLGIMGLAILAVGGIRRYIKYKMKN